MNSVFSVGQAADWLANPGEPKDKVANQLRRYRSKGYVQSRGTFGSGPTATHTFDAVDLGTAKLCRALTALGIKDEALMESVSEACYDLPAKGADLGSTPGMVAALDHPHAGWHLFVFLSDQADGTQRVFAEVHKIEGAQFPEHPAIDAFIALPMRQWLPSLAELKAAN